MEDTWPMTFDYFNLRVIQVDTVGKHTLLYTHYNNISLQMGSQLSAAHYQIKHSDVMHEVPGLYSWLYDYNSDFNVIPLK